MRSFPGGGKHSFHYVIKTGVCGVAGMKFDQAGGAFGIKEKLQRVLGGGFGWSECVEGRAGVNLEILAIARVFRRSRWDNFQQRFRKGKRFGLECGEDCGESAALFGGRDDLRGDFSIAT